MSQIIKAFTGILLILSLMMTGIGVLKVFMEVSNAQKKHAAIINELENSAYAENVLKGCFTETQACGYQLEISLYSESLGTVKCTNAAEVPADTTTISMAKVLLKYPLQIGILDLDIEQEISGYTR